MKRLCALFILLAFLAGAVPPVTAQPLSTQPTATAMTGMDMSAQTPCHKPCPEKTGKSSPAACCANGGCLISLLPPSHSPVTTGASFRLPAGPTPAWQSIPRAGPQKPPQFS